MVQKIILNGLKGVNLIQGGPDDPFRCILDGYTKDGKIEIHYSPKTRQELDDIIDYFTTMSRQLYWNQPFKK